MACHRCKRKNRAAPPLVGSQIASSGCGRTMTLEEEKLFIKLLNDSATMKKIMRELGQSKENVDCNIHYLPFYVQNISLQKQLAKEQLVINKIKNDRERQKAKRVLQKRMLEPMKSLGLLRRRLDVELQNLRRRGKWR